MSILQTRPRDAQRNGVYAVVCLFIYVVETAPASGLFISPPGNVGPLLFSMPFSDSFFCLFFFLVK